MIKLPSKKVAIEPIFDADKIGSIWIPDQAKMRCDQGIVKYIGNKVREVKVGDYVLFSGYSGTLVDINGEEQLIIMLEKFVVCILHPDPTVIPGLFFRSIMGDLDPTKEEGFPRYEYFEATHEEAFHQIALAFQHSKFRQNHGITNRRSLPDVPYTEEHEDEEDE